MLILVVAANLVLIFKDWALSPILFLIVKQAGYVTKRRTSENGFVFLTV
jgi:hypothetical protein